MHELSIALAILDLAEVEAEGRGLGRVAAIHLRLGPLCGVVEEALQSAYQLAREGTDLEAADLVIERVSLVTYCPACAAERKLESVQELFCPQCGAPTSEVVRGRELEVTALEIES
jgi:hydrogenase nickel incorporation protein HypA/HybF